MDAVIPPPRKIPEGQKPETTATSGGSRPEESREPGKGRLQNSSGTEKGQG